MKQELIYLDTYVLQQDMRIRMPKAILKNLGAVKGVTNFDIYFETNSQKLILEISKNKEDK